MFRSYRSVLMLVAGVGVLAPGYSAYSQTPRGAGPAGPAEYQQVDNFFHMPDGRKTGSTAGITVDRDGSSVWTFDRCGGNDCVGSSVAPIVKFDASGRGVTRFGAGMFVRPHGIHIDRDGHVWVTDSDGHQVSKFTAEGRHLMTLGTPKTAGDGPNAFNMPSAVLIAPNGDIFVGDGHGGESNARVVKFSKDGKFIKTWGKKGTAPGEFETPHALAMDSRGRLFVGDRGNNRIQIFDQDGRFLEEWKQFGRPSGMFIDRNDNLYVSDHTSNEKTNPGFRPGIAVGSARDGRKTAFIPDPDADPSQEGVAADAHGNIYGSLTRGMAVRKYVRK